MAEAFMPGGRSLVLLVDNDVEARRRVRHLLELRRLEVVQASNGIAALELIQRLPQSFRLVLTDLDLPGIPGPAFIEALRIFRPDLPVLCMAGTQVVAGVQMKGCLSKPLQSGELDAALQEGASGWEPQTVGGVSEAAAGRARARFALVGDLVEAALELSRGMSGQA